MSSGSSGDSTPTKSAPNFLISATCSGLLTVPITFRSSDFAIALLDARDASSDHLDDPRTFTTDHRGQFRVQKVHSVCQKQVAVSDRCVFHPHKSFAFCWRGWFWNFEQF